jgi:chorismate dehydratase
MRIAASTYLNSAPLIYSFAYGVKKTQVTLLGDTAPAVCSRMLEHGDCDVALIPVIESIRIPDLIVVPDIAVASKHRVRSVILVSKVPIERARRVALDASSRTSQTLVRILFAHRYSADPELFERIPDTSSGCENMLSDCDAALIIGDPAMRIASSSNDRKLHIYDLAEEWRAMTGLPFVFAVWATRDRQLSRSTIFLDAKTEGLAHRREIAGEFSRRLELPEADLLDYLMNSVNYDLDSENFAGMEHFFKLARSLPGSAPGSAGL